MERNLSEVFGLDWKSIAEIAHAQKNRNWETYLALDAAQSQKLGRLRIQALVFMRRAHKLVHYTQGRSALGCFSLGANLLTDEDDSAFEFAQEEFLPLWHKMCEFFKLRYAEYQQAGVQTPEAPSIRSAFEMVDFAKDNVEQLMQTTSMTDFNRKLFVLSNRFLTC